MTMNEINNQLSYRFIQNSIRKFRHLKADEFNLYDEPGTYWFKPMFYFYRSEVHGSDNDINNEGLLHPSWNDGYVGDGHITDKPGQWSNIGSAERKKILENKFASSAYNYLRRNDEEERANLLRQFITLLSNISSRSPWYFQEVAGLDTAIDHSEAFKNGVFVGDDRKQITFTLMQDAVDDRIGTLMDLYRAVCYDWKNKREVLPANLRKFDMGLYIHGSMIQNDRSDVLFSKLALSGALSAAEQLGAGYTPSTEIVNAAGKYEYETSSFNTGDIQSSAVSLGVTPSGQPITTTKNTPVTGTSYKPKGMSHVYIEFVNCEIDLSSSKGGDTISNTEGSERKYTLTISYDDCYVNRYNNFIIGAIGDYIVQDFFKINEADGISTNNYYGVSNNATLGRGSNGGLIDKVIGNLEGATLGRAEQAISDTVGNMLLGNLYGLDLMNKVRDVTSGRIISTGVNELNKMLTGNNTAITPGKTIYGQTPPRQAAVKALGNLYRSAGVLSNI